MNDTHHIADAQSGNWVERHAPGSWRPYLQLARYDRPVGFWLLGLPCAFGMALARLDQSWQWSDLALLILFAIGALAMRGAGCTWNDILDRDLDAKVARTAQRPLPAGLVTLKQAILFMGGQLLVGLIVLLLLPRAAQLMALGSIPLVALYPLMKRITWWPQAWLGLTFNWGVLVAYVAITGAVHVPLLVVYAGLVFWTLGYDTIYALQDAEDDALIGVKSTARLFGRHSRTAVTILYFICLGLLMVGGSQQALTLAPDLQRPAQYGVLVATIFFALNLSNQAFRTEFDKPAHCLAAFKANTRAGLEYAALLAIAPVGLSLAMALKHAS